MTQLTPTSLVHGAMDRESLQRRRTNVTNVIVPLLLWLALLVTLAALVALIGTVVSRGWSVFDERPRDFLSSGLSRDPAKAGVWQGIRGTLEIAVFVTVIAFPIGIATAVYLEEYARDNRLTRFIAVNVRNLAGVPSVVYGILGVTVLVSGLRGITGGRSVISGGVILAVLVLPLVIITAAEAIRAVPQSLREGGYGIGASQWQVIRRLVLPAAAPGILTGTVLALSRALGETAPLLLVGAATGFLSSGNQSFVEQLRGSFTALPVVVYRYSTQPGAEFRHLAGAAIVVLLLITLLINAIAVFLRSRYERPW